VRELIVRTLEKQPARRPQTADELAAAIERALATATRETPPVVPSDVVIAATGARTTVRNTDPPMPLPTPSTAPTQPPEYVHSVKRRWLIVAALLGAVGAVAISAFVSRGFARPSLVVGMLPDQRLTTERLKEYEPVSTFLAGVTHRKVELVVSASYSETLEQFVDGRCDIAHLGGVSYVLAKERYPQVVPLVQRASDRQFHALFLGSEANGIKTLEQAKGKRVGFVDPLSTSGWVVPATFLLAKGIHPERDVFPIFTHAHDMTLEALAKGQLDVGVVDESVYDRQIYLQKVKRSEFAILDTSPEFPDDIWVCRDSVDPAMRDAIVKAFLKLDQAHGQDHVTLAALEAESTHFVAARDQDYDGIRQMLARLREAKIFKD
jgi:phosphonate transport system substrate-binding protein